MKSHNRQTEAYKTDRPLKFHECDTLSIVAKHFPHDNCHILDIGCASGSLITELAGTYQYATIHGLERDPELISIARKRLERTSAIIHEADAFHFSPPTTFDLIIASGIITVFDDQLKALDQWLSWLSDGGTIILFTHFTEKEIDFIIHHRSHNNDKGWETGLSVFSTHTYSNHLNTLGLDHYFKDFRLPVLIEESSDPIRSYSVEQKHGPSMIVYGGVVISDQKFLVITKNTAT